MSGYKATGKIEKVNEWSNEKVHPLRDGTYAVGLQVAIPASEFTGLDITRPITITQEES